MVLRPCLFCNVCICTLWRRRVLFGPRTAYDKIRAHQIGGFHRKWKNWAFSLGTVVLTKVTRQRYFSGRIASKRPFREYSATHERELGEIKNSLTIGLYAQIHKTKNLGVLSELDWIWWPRPGSNRRHTDFQSVALPTELPSHRCICQGSNGRGAGIRTLDPVIKSHLLYQLSYAPISPWLSLERGTGFEPATTTLARWHSTN